MNLISGEKLQELADITIIFKDQRHEDLWLHQLPNISNYVILEGAGSNIPTQILEADVIFEKNVMINLCYVIKTLI